jgi:outer membrane protein assembly factor BamB
VTDFAAPQAWPKQLKKQWSVQVGTSDATPALVGDKLYTFSGDRGEETISCLKADSGMVSWQDKYPSKGAGFTGDNGHQGPRSSPAISNGKVVTLGVGGVLSCLDAASGQVAWRKDSASITAGMPQFHTASSPLIVDGMCVVQLGGNNKGSVAALDLNSGEVKWKADTDGTTYSSPALMTVDGTRMIVAQSAGSLVGLSVTDGKELWKVGTPGQRMAYNAATPVVDGSNVIYTGGGSGTKSFKVEKQGDSFKATQEWVNDKFGTAFNTPVVKDGALYGIAQAGSLYCLDVGPGKGGALLWMKPQAVAGRGFASIIDAGSVLLLMSSSSELVVLKPSEKEYTEVAKIKLSDAQTYAHPVVSGPRIFVQDQGAVTMYTIE